MSDNVLSCNKVSKQYIGKNGPVTVLAEVTFSVVRGTVTVIGGRSGAGKSTLLSLLAGLDLPTSGSIEFEGQRLETLTNAELAALRRARLGLIFQNFNLLPSWTAFENVEAALLHQGIAPRERRERIEELCSELGLADHLDHLPAEMSIGQQQRVAVARTLINHPSLLLADEPTGSVDPETAGEMLELLLAPVRAGAAAMIVTTHGSFPPEIGDAFYKLREGRIVPQTVEYSPQL